MLTAPPRCLFFCIIPIFCLFNFQMLFQKSSFLLCPDKTVATMGSWPPDQQHTQRSKYLTSSVSSNLHSKATSINHVTGATHTFKKTDICSKCVFHTHTLFTAKTTFWIILEFLMVSINPQLCFPGNKLTLLPNLLPTHRFTQPYAGFPCHNAIQTLSKEFCCCHQQKAYEYTS